MKLSALALVLGVTFSGSVFAVTNEWNSPSPWGTAATVQYADWNSFDGVYSDDAAAYVPVLDTTPNVHLSAGTTASIQESSGGLSGAFITGGGASGNIYSFDAATQFTATLSGNTNSFYDVYLRVATVGNPVSLSATLNGFSKTGTVTLTAGSGRNIEQEVFWVWKGVAGSSLYTFNFNASGSSMSLDQVALATTISAVPEPETYGMMAMGLGLVALTRRRASKNKA